MAGDLGFQEILIVHPAPGAAPLSPEEQPRERALAPLKDELERNRVLLRYGDRVEIRAGALLGTSSRELATPSGSALSDAVLQGLSETEKLGVEALQLRRTPGYKPVRSRDGERWDMTGCAGAPVTSEPTRRSASAAKAVGTSDYLKGSVALGVVIVNGPTAATQFTQAERLKVVAEVQAGAAWLANFNRWANVSFSFDIHNLSITTQPNAAAADNESRFRNPAMASLGFQANWNGVWDYVNSLRSKLHTNWAYCVFFVKGYPVNHFAYASIGGPRIVMDYANDGWGPDNIDRVFAHETGHIFQAPDEYASSGCNCGGTWGRFGEPNANCENCAGAAGVACLMRANTWAMCGSTKRHLGWGLTSMRTSQPSMCQVVSRSLDHLDVFVCDSGSNTLTAAWEPAMVSWWEGWWGLLGGRAAPGAPVTAVSRRPDQLDVFVVGTDGGAYTCAWNPGTGWRGWWRIGTAVFPQGAMIQAVVRSQDHLDIFATDCSGRVLSAAWEPAFTDGWHGWWQILGGAARPGAPVTAVSRSANKLDIFVIGTNGGCYTAAWEPSFGSSWHGWWRIGNAVFPQGAFVGAVSRNLDHLDVFATDNGSKVLTAAWNPSSGGWKGWWQILNGKANPGAPVGAVSRSKNKLDVFVVGTDNIIYTAAWEPASPDGWHGWWNLNGGRAAHGSLVTAVSRRPDFMDIFMIGQDGRAWSAAWSPGHAWAGWWPMGK